MSQTFQHRLIVPYSQFAFQLDTKPTDSTNHFSYMAVEIDTPTDRQTADRQTDRHSLQINMILPQFFTSFSISQVPVRFVDIDSPD